MSAESYGAFDDGDVSLDGLYVLCRVLDVRKYLAQRWLLEHLTNEREGGRDVCLDYIPWNLIGPASVNGLQVGTCFFKVQGVLIDVFWAIVHLWPPGSHNAKSTRLHA